MTSRTPKHQRGAIMVLTTVALVALIGIVGLAIDFGFAYDYKLRAQIAADAAAIAAALEPEDYLNAGRELAKANGFEHNKNGIEVAITNPYSGDGLYVPPEDYFEAVIKQSYPSFLLGIFGIDALPIHARAVATAGGSCGQGSFSCLMVGKMVIDKNRKVLKSDLCEIYVDKDLSCSNQLEVKSVTIGKDATSKMDGCKPSEEVIKLEESIDLSNKIAIPDFDSLDCTGKTRHSGPGAFECNQDKKIDPGCYYGGIIRTGKSKKSCIFGKGDYYIINGRFEIYDKISQEAGGNSFYIKCTPDANKNCIKLGYKVDLTSGGEGQREEGALNPNVLFYVEPQGGVQQIIDLTGGGSSELSGDIIGLGAEVLSPANISLTPLGGGGGGGVGDLCLLVE